MFAKLVEAFVFKPASREVSSYGLHASGSKATSSDRTVLEVIHCWASKLLTTERRLLLLLLGLASTSVCTDVVSCWI